jgi:hypothetical protein
MSKVQNYVKYLDVSRNVAISVGDINDFRGQGMKHINPHKGTET